MNDDAAHREEHIGEHLQNAVLNGIDRRFSLRSPQTRFSPFPQYANGKTALTLLPFVTWPSGRYTTSRRIRTGCGG